MQKKTLLLFLIFFLCFSCNKQEQPQHPQPTYIEQIIGNYQVLEQAFMSKSLDLDVDGDSSASLFNEPYYLKSGFHSNMLKLNYAADEPGYYYLLFNTYYGYYGSLGYDFIQLSMTYLISIDNDTKQFEIFYRYPENHDINSNMYVYLHTIEADGKRVKVVLNQNFLVWDWNLNDFKLENVDVTYVFRKLERGESIPD